MTLTKEEIQFLIKIARNAMDDGFQNYLDKDYDKLEEIEKKFNNDNKRESK